MSSQIRMSDFLAMATAADFPSGGAEYMADPEINAIHRTKRIFNL